ncbi:small ribosomal subunit protein uS10-like [Callorhinus ursinus]|uniref:small ribosomal subunit protein uS10-like n=1 Tax=Callorhinus ursinus TaxID=34884 RepID=UPI003CD047B8
MAFKDTRKTPMEQEVVIHQIRITLTNHNVKSLEKVCAALVDQRQKSKESQSERKVQMPTKTLRINIRKLAVKFLRLRDHFQVRIHKRLFDLHSPSEIVKHITSIRIEPKVEVEVTLQLLKSTF